MRLLGVTDGCEICVASVVSALRGAWCLGKDEGLE